MISCTMDAAKQNLPRLYMFSLFWTTIFVCLTGYPLRSAETGPTVAFCDTVSQIPVTECAALAALYLQTNGTQWAYNAGWMESKEPCSWVGVFCQAGHVTGLTLSFNLISGALPPDIGDLVYLETLNLIRNKITSIPTEIGNLSALRELILSDNRLREIPASIGHLTQLETLHLSENAILSLPSEIGDLVNLKVLHLVNNHSLQNIPAEFARLSNLRELRTSVSSTGQILSALPTMSYLTILDLSGNRLVLFPQAISTLTDLRELYLSNNALVAIPAEISQLTQLEKFDLAQNQLATIPNSLQSLTELTHLDLSNNQLSELPAELGLLSKLEELNLASNQLVELPAEVGYLTNLYRGLYLSYNRLATIPDVVDSSRFPRGDWRKTQTTPPGEVMAEIAGNQQVKLTWHPILYGEDSGYYEISAALQPDGPYEALGRTQTKGDQSYLAQVEQPGSYYFAVRTYTSAHDSQRNYLWSDYSPPLFLALISTTANYLTGSVGSTFFLRSDGFSPGTEVTIAVNGKVLDSLKVEVSAEATLKSAVTVPLEFNLITQTADPGRYRIQLTAIEGTEPVESQIDLWITATDELRPKEADLPTISIPGGLAQPLNFPDERNGDEILFLPLISR